MAIPHTPELLSLDRRDLAVILAAALPALREKIEDAELTVVRHERFQAQFPFFAGDFDSRDVKLRNAVQQLDELRLAYASALSAQSALDHEPAEEFTHDVAAYLRKQYGARPFGGKQ